MRIKQYPTHVIDSLWHGNADALAIAMERNSGECTGDQLKLLLMRGEMLLIGSPDLWAAVQAVQHPNKRTLHVFAVASTRDGSGMNADDITELSEYARNIGCTALTCSADKAAERLYARYGFQSQYTTMGIPL